VGVPEVRVRVELSRSVVTVRLTETPSVEREMSEMTDTDIRPRMTLDAPEWRDFALCRVTDPEAFFPETGENGRPAKRVCAGCEVREACLAEALAHDERFGIWGGLTAAERRKRYPKHRR
jgi:WhiB family redox-sensing transcriptional regulator